MLPVLLTLLLIFSHFKSGESRLSYPPLATALYVFGDSLADSGNNNWLPTISRVNYPPYGIDFLNGRPTGRATNGKTVADFLCDYLLLPYVPPYNSWRKPLNWLTGYNYASGACGILPDTRIGGCDSLDDQVSKFQRTVETDLAPHFKDREELSQYLSKSIFLFVIGGNDYLINYFVNSTNMSTIYTAEEFADLLLDKLSQKLQILYDLGARKAIVFEIVPFGCSPMYRDPSDPSGMACDEEKNQIAQIFNRKLALKMQNLTSTLQGSHFIRAHIYELSYDAYKNPAKYGLTNTKDTCCPLRGDGSCIWSPSWRPTPPCQNRSEYYFWDGSHPTEAIYYIQSSECIYGNSTCLPLNIHQLLQVETNLHTSMHSVI